MSSSLLNQFFTKPHDRPTTVATTSIRPQKRQAIHSSLVPRKKTTPATHPKLKVLLNTNCKKTSSNIFSNQFLPEKSSKIIKNHEKSSKIIPKRPPNRAFQVFICPAFRSSPTSPSDGPAPAPGGAWKETKRPGMRC